MALRFALVMLCLCTVSVQCVWVKEMENEGAFEGDIILDPDERKIIESTHSYGSMRGGRWPEGVVPYFIDESIEGESKRAMIMTAINDYHEYTCIQFRPKLDEDTAYIQFRYGVGCSSFVGHRPGTANYITLGEGCYDKGAIMHEIGHSMGFFHEQSRPDRDEYIRINFDNIPKDEKNNFGKKRPFVVDSLGTSYDLESMMHYGAFAFAISDKKRTIETIDPTKNKLIGQRNGFSPTDIIQLNKMYNCEGIMKTLPPKVCVDKIENCYVNVRRGDCTNPHKEHLMYEICCKSCEDPNCYDVNENCESYAADGYCTLEGYVDYMKRNCCKTCKEKAAN